MESLSVPRRLRQRHAATVVFFSSAKLHFFSSPLKSLAHLPPFLPTISPSVWIPALDVAALPSPSSSERSAPVDIAVRALSAI